MQTAQTKKLFCFGFFLFYLTKLDEVISSVCEIKVDWKISK